jgi:uncharacterized protein YyaL (SSP411 family)
MLKFVTLLLGSAICLRLGPVEWQHNMDEAKALAQKEHRHILLNFSGSDWCGACIQMHKEIFDKEAFQQMADSSLILVNADFPRMSKNKLPAQQQRLNDAMADKYNSQGKFPFTILLTADGKVLKTWEWFPGMKPDVFTREVQTIIDGDK